jgi:hypothetical protein
MKVPIFCGMFLAAPSLLNTAVWIAVNQTYNAGHNFTNKKANMRVSQQDLLKGYAGALLGSVGVGCLIRRVSAKTLAGISPNAVLGGTYFVHVMAARFGNLAFPSITRQEELKNGIRIYED